MGPSLHAEIAIMVGILVGAWVLKVIAVAIYMICSKRRVERLQQRQTELTFGSCKPTPDHIIQSLPVMPYAKLLNHLGLGVAAPAAHQAPPQQQQFASALQAAVFAGCLNSSSPTAHSPYPPQPQAAQNVAGGIPASPRFSLCNPSPQVPEKALTTSQSAASLHTSSSFNDMTRQQSQQSSDRDCCPICFNDYEACSEVKQLPCRHYYHSECIDQWLVRDNTCPLCKSPVWTPPCSKEQAATAAEAAPGAAGADSAESSQTQVSLAILSAGTVDVDRVQEAFQSEEQHPAPLQQVVVVGGD